MEYKFTVDNFEKEVLQEALPVLVDFYAESIPTFMIFKGGEVAKTFIGGRSADDFCDEIDEVL